jgi:hypothetical protein
MPLSGWQQAAQAIPQLCKRWSNRISPANQSVTVMDGYVDIQLSIIMSQEAQDHGSLHFKFRLPASGLQGWAYFTLV